VQIAPSGRVARNRTERRLRDDRTDYSGEVKRVVGANVHVMARLIEEVFATGEPACMEAPVATSRGVGVSHLRLVPERDANGTVRSVLGIGRDITAIRESEREARTLSDRPP